MRSVCDVCEEMLDGGATGTAAMWQCTRSRVAVHAQWGDGAGAVRTKKMRTKSSGKCSKITPHTREQQRGNPMKTTEM